MGRTRCVGSLALFFLLFLLGACIQGRTEPEGLRLMALYGCTTCHSVDGTRVLGPTFLGLFGTVTEVTREGKDQRVRVDEKYLTRSILDPRWEVVKGYPPDMPTRYEAVMSPQHRETIVAYLKTLGSAEGR